MNELPIIQKTYDAIQWYIPILNRLPREHRFGLGNRMVSGLYDFLEGLIRARYRREDRKTRLQDLNIQLDILRYQTRLLHDFKLISAQRHEYASEQLQSIGQDLGSWIKTQEKS